MSNEYEFEEGVRRAIDLLEAIESKPLLVAVYGERNAGKSTLISLLKKFFELKGLKVTGFSGNPSSSSFTKLNAPKDVDMFLYHCLWDRELKFVQKEDPEVLAPKYFGKDLDLNIGIYNPKREKPIKGIYDLIIRNRKSVKKEDKQSGEEMYLSDEELISTLRRIGK